jgi:hypothetical protein
MDANPTNMLAQFLALIARFNLAPKADKKEGSRSFTRVRVDSELHSLHLPGVNTYTRTPIQVGFNHVDCQLLIQLGFITVL